MNLLGKATDKNFWKSVREKDCFKAHLDELSKMWDKYCGDETIPAFKYSNYKLFWETGDRKEYETQYFGRRNALDCSLLLTLIYPENEKYRERLNDIIFSICDEYSWCLPAHQGSLDEVNETKLDLFACETGFALSEIYTVAGEYLDPLIKNRIKKEVDRRIITPFASVDNYGEWENWDFNWTAVCMGSVASSIMLMRPEIANDAMIARFNRAMDRYIGGLGDDGVCLEGGGYWDYGFCFFTVYADMVRAFTNGNVDYFKQDKVERVAGFLQTILICENCAVSFADAGSTFSYHSGLLHYLKDRYPHSVSVFSPKYWSKNITSRFCSSLRSFIWFNEEYYYNPASADEDFERFSEKSGWFIKRTASYGFAAKGGHNGEPHNHNDVGSFIFAKNRRQVIVDLGSGLYTRQYFSANRYSFLEASSRSHSVPVIDGKYQIASGGARATDVNFENGELSMNIVGGYGDIGIERIDRRFSFTEDGVTLSDSFVYDGEHSVVERLVSLIEPDISGVGTVKLDEVTVSYAPDICDCFVTSEYTTRYPDKLCYMIDFKLKNGVNEFSCSIK